MDILLAGQITIQKIDENGNILTIGEFLAPDIIGAKLIFSKRNHYPLNVSSQSDALILHVNKEMILNLSRTNGEFLNALLEMISDRATVLTDKINQISLKSIRQKIVDFLNYESCAQNSDVIKLNTSKRNLAERFGIQRSSLSRELSKMKADGLLEYDSRTITKKY
mgnify:FL=1|jgi:CRP/FNR family transcriptional regulator, dissimilatory nitrate respiration regulator